MPLSSLARCAWSCVAGFGLLAGLAAVGASQEKKDDKTAADKVPLRKVVMYSSGVGFFEHTGSVEADATVDLKFNVDDINDLLKSMVVQDLGGGQISTVTYGSRDPITRTLKTFSIDLTTNPSLADLLRQIRGEKVEVEAPNKISGIILGVEDRTKKVDDEAVKYHVLNLLTDGGLRSISLETVTSIRLLNEKLDAELRQALLILATGHSTDKKTVSLSFRGKGRRDVRIGYIQETPIWKTSYRLVLDDEGKPHLQGWAIVENTTESDWNDVSLTLISGRPISFKMDLYQPLYVNRPLVVPELYASLSPRTYDQDLAAADKDFAGAAERAKQLAVNELQRKADEARDGFALRERRSAAPAAPPGKPGLAAGIGGVPGDADMDMTSSVKSLADASDIGELFQYKIETPVDLVRQQSAMLPIVDAEIDGEKVSIYNQSTHAKHPLNGLQFTNTTDLHLLQGPITVYDGGAYAGDSKIQDLPPKSTRLISYALDLDTEVAPSSTGATDELVSVKVAKGTLSASRKHRRTNTWIVKNSGSKTKKVLIEYPIDTAWKLVAPEKPAEKTRDMYRFAVQAEPGKPAELKAEEERIVSQAVYLSNLDDNTIRIYLSATVVSEKVKEALREVVKRKQALSLITAQRQRLEQQINTITVEQNRIRQNMAQLDRTTDLYNRYVKKFGEQEDEIEMLRVQIAKLQDDEDKQRKSMDEYLLGLNLD